MGHNHPRLRPVELVRGLQDGSGLVLRDPSGHSPHMLSVSGAALFILAKLDGRHDLPTIQAAFMRKFGQMLFSHELESLLQRLDDALLLDSPRFAEHVAQSARMYRERPCRAITIQAEWNGEDGAVDKYFCDLLSQDGVAVERRGALLGFVAPHLDYRRGRPCYAAAYRDVATHTDAARFVVLGTNHFGSCTSVVGTRKDFATPFGVVRHDRDFMNQLDRELGHDLCAGELDHAREHSVELQVHVLAHVLRGRAFTFVPYLCPDPCGPSGTRPRGGSGVDLRDFAQALGRLVRADPTPTCIIAGADLSHVGAYFNDSTPLDPDSLATIEAYDRRVLSFVEAGDPEGFRSAVAATDNATSICSVGCIFALATALRGAATASLRHYHQSVTPEVQNCVTCSAIDFVAR